MNTLKSLTACLAADEASHGAPVALVRAAIQDYLGKAPPAEAAPVALRDALGRILAEPLVSPFDVPPHANSAMDGYAFDARALLSAGQPRLRVVGKALAGHPHDGPVNAGECVRIMTGAVVPAGCDTVVPQEDVQADAPGDVGSTIVFDAARVAAGANRRAAGEDLARGQVALPAGRRLRPADLGLAASLGIARVTVRRRLRVAVFSTGDELRLADQPLDPGAIYDSNRVMLEAALRRLGIEVTDLGIVPDRPDALEDTLRGAIGRGVDAVIASGGVSAGDADFTGRRAQALGDLAMLQVAMRPGRPLAFGRLRGTVPGLPGPVFFGLPGNPVAALVSYYVFVRDALLDLAGAERRPVPLVKARCGQALRKRAGRTEYQRAVVSVAPEDGELQATPTGRQGSGILSSMSEANCLIVLPPENRGVAPGEMVDVLLFDGLV